MNDRSTVSKQTLPGSLLIAFGIYVLAASIVGAMAFDAFVIDVVGFIIIYLGTSVSRGSSRAARWAKIIMCYYLVMAVLLIVLCSVAPERISVGGRPIKAAEVPLALILVGIMGVWAIINLLLLRKQKAARSLRAEGTSK